MSENAIIIREENIKTIVSAAPQTYKENTLSCQKCNEAGQKILDAIRAGGMTDELDQQAASFIDKARKTVKKLNEKRSPVTKLFDEIRTQFTAQENSIDPTKKDTIPYQLQLKRNEYAALKRQQEEKRRQEEYIRQQRELAKTSARTNIEEDLRKQFDSYLTECVNRLNEKLQNMTLDTYTATLQEVTGYSVMMPEQWYSDLKSTCAKPVNLDLTEFKSIEQKVKKELHDKFSQQFSSEMTDNREYILERLPSKKQNLQRMAAASAEEAERLKKEEEARRARELAAKEEERRKKEEEERAKAEFEKSQQSMADLFTGEAAAQSYQPKVKVTQKIELLSPDGIMPILSLWWTEEGRNLSVEELNKIFKKQIKFAEDAANKNGNFIKDSNIRYIEEVKAK